MINKPISNCIRVLLHHNEHHTHLSGVIVSLKSLLVNLYQERLCWQQEGNYAAPYLFNKKSNKQETTKFSWWLRQKERKKEKKTHNFIRFGAKFSLCKTTCTMNSAFEMTNLKWDLVWCIYWCNIVRWYCFHFW